MDLFCFVVSISLSLPVGVWLFYRNGRGISSALAIVACCVVFVLGYWGGSSLLLKQSVFTGVALAVCLSCDAKPRTLLGWTLASMLLSYASIAPGIYQTWTYIAAMRDEYPLESLAGRLDYEALRVRTPVEDKLSKPVKQSLAVFEEREGTNRRQFSLYSLHRRTQIEFVLNQGFGRVRMGGVSRSVIRLPETEPLPLRNAPQRETVTATLPGPAASGLPRESLEGLHYSGRLDFLEPERMGYVRDREHVAGFLSHEFTVYPELDGREWIVTQLELISLLKHETPVAYISRNLPRMDELVGAPTRPLNTFEMGALKQLQFERDLVIEENLDSIRMVGALRASSDCMKCHNVSRGELLGAFSYVLHWMPAANQSFCRQSSD